MWAAIKPEPPVRRTLTMVNVSRRRRVRKLLVRVLLGSIERYQLRGVTTFVCFYLGAAGD
jgi:hypothetical protein